MNFFNQEVSNNLQFITLFMEIVGISLAYIEIRYKDLKHTIEVGIMSSETKLRQLSWKLAQNNLFSGLVTLFVIVLFFFEIPYLAGFFDEVLPQEWQGFQETLYWITFPVVILFILAIGLIFFGEFVGWLNRFSEGHAIGSLGVVVTGVGLVGELYQIMTIIYG